MALDFFLANSQRSAERGDAIHVLSLEEDLHARLFSSGLEGLRGLDRLGDFHSDVRFGNLELSALLADVLLAASLVSDRELQEFLGALKGTCERAVRDGLLLVTRCD